jgi:hypothetical protein
MSQLVSGTAQPYLTTYARGLVPNMDPVINRFAPIVVTGAVRGQFKRWDDKNTLLVPDARRAVGGPRRRIEFLGSDGTYFMKSYGLEIGIDDQERDGAINLEEAKTAALVAQGFQARAAAVMAVVNSRSADATPAWSTPTSGNPIADINTQILAIAQRTNQMPTDIVFSPQSWAWLVQHNTIADKFKTGIVNATAIQAAGLLLNPSIRISVSTLAADTAKAGATKSSGFVTGNNVYIFISNDSPSLYDTSWLKTFRKDASGIEVVRMYRDESHASDMLALDWAEDIQLVHTDGARRLTPT